MVLRMSDQAVRPAERFGDQFQQVLAAAQVGAGWAAERLWHSLAPTVHGYLRAQGVIDAEDLTSEVFIGVFNGIGTFQGDEERFRSWVFTIAHRRLTDERRRVGRRPRPARFGEEESRAEPLGDSAENTALRRLGAERVRLLCGRLVPDQRDVLLLRMVAGLTVDEVAAALDKSPGAVKQLQRRAVLALRKNFSQEGVPL
ncbi:MAG TPA: sigma-70 family RNA polymerase sigma factor [Acidimicrobiales bacterium]|nr:sigma-70 family RNA polymerase sigma factor [Acidimicrobiales bacterium]